MDYESIRSCLSELYVNIDNFIMAAYRQDDYNSRRINWGIMKNLQKLMNNYITDILRMEEFQDGLIVKELEEILKLVCMAQENEDFLYVADLYAGQLKMLIERIMYLVVMNLDLETSEQDGVSRMEYVVECANAGVPTLKVNKDGKQFYLHSNINPFMEAELFIAPKAEPVKPIYIVYGLGLGYHIWALHNKCPYAKILVFESDVNIIEKFSKYAKKLLFGEDMGDVVQIILDSEYTKFAQALSEHKDVGVIIHQPSIRLITNSEIKEKMENFLITTNTIKNSGRFLDGNFYENTKGKYHLIDEIKEEFYQKEVIFIAGGPSLDADMEYLKKISEKYVVVAVGTVFRKLLSEQIVPDYVIMTDSQPNMINQIKDCPSKETTLLYMCTCDKNSVDYYQGKKYMFLQNEYEPAEKLAAKKNSMLFSTGGSVSTSAVDIFIKMKCKRVICLGLDLAVPGYKTHASGTLWARDVKNKDCRMVKAFDGGQVPTLKNLDVYRIFIEKDIQMQNAVEFVNSSKGAYIHGMKHMCLEEILA